MKTHASLMRASASVVALLSISFAGAASAQTSSDGPALTAESSTLGEVVVTARRRNESLQEVPQTVNAIPADTLQKLNLTNFTDIQTVAPGVALSQGNSGFGAQASMRGISYTVFASNNPTVAQYLNDAPVLAIQTFQSMFDIGQIEVLKGPQGTTRGIAAPSGAITISTHKPNLSEFGGYGSTILTDLGNRNVQGALNVPIIRDVLAVRVAGVLDDNDFDGVRSIHNGTRPYAKTNGGRFSVSYEPSDIFNATVMYQHLDREQSGFKQVTGPGAGTAVNPAIRASQRVAVEDSPTTFKQQFDSVVAQADSRLFGQHLSYVGAYHHFKIKQAEEQDTGNILPGVDLYATTRSVSEITTHELRLASDPAPGRFFDYTVGAFYSWSAPNTTLVQPGPLQSGAFGPPNLPPSLGAFNPSFQIPILLAGPGTIQETSFFGNLTLHLGDRTELSGGLRNISLITQSNLNGVLGNGKIALPASLFGGQCAASTYAGFCDVTLPTGGTVVSNTSSRDSDNKTIYNITLSHRLTKDLLLYFNTGTAFRGATPSFGVQGGLANTTDPLLRTLTFHPSETSTSYEVGFKATLLDGRARVNAAMYRQTFDNFTVYVPGITYFNTVTRQPTQGNMTASVDAEVQGFDVDAAWQITPAWNLAVQGSYAHSQIKDSLVPCNITGPNGAPVFNRGDAANPAGLISMCPGESASQLPLWNLNVQTEYVHPVSSKVDGFVRGLLNYYPENKYVEPNFTAPSYTLVNLYAGVRSSDGAWEASIFARNAFNTNKQLDQGPAQITGVSGVVAGSFPTLVRPSGYFTALSTPRREVGVSLRYAFGSR